MNKLTKQCVECKVNEARHWSSSFCEECFKVILNEQLAFSSRKLVEQNKIKQ